MPQLAASSRKVATAQQVVVAGSGSSRAPHYQLTQVSAGSRALEESACGVGWAGEAVRVGVCKGADYGGATRARQRATRVTFIRPASARTYPLDMPHASRERLCECECE